MAGALDVTGFNSEAAREFAAEAAYTGRLGTVARLAAEAAEEDAFLVTVPAVQLLGVDFRDHVYGLRRRGDEDWKQAHRPISFRDDTEIVVRFLRRSPAHEWLIADCVPRDDGTGHRRAYCAQDGTSDRFKGALVTYGFGGDESGVAALARSTERGALRWFTSELAQAGADDILTPAWWGRLLYPGGLAADDTETVAADLGRLSSWLTPVRA